jgi:hypothetical protein
MNKTAPRRRSLALAIAACATALTSAFAAAPANAGGLVSPIIAPITVDIPPSAPAAGGGGSQFGGTNQVMFWWGASAPGTSVGPLEYHWAVFSSTCSWIPLEVNNTAVTSSTIATFGSTSGCTYTVGVQAFGLNKSGSYMQSGWTFFPVTAAPNPLQVFVAALNPVSGVSVTKNYKGSGFTRINWTNQTQPSGFGTVWTLWDITHSSAGSADPAWAHSGGEFGNSIMLKLTPGVTYTVYLGTHAFLNGVPYMPNTGYSVTFTA